MGFGITNKCKGEMLDLLLGLDDLTQIRVFMADNRYASAERILLGFSEIEAKHVGVERSLIDNLYENLQNRKPDFPGLERLREDFFNKAIKKVIECKCK